MTNGSAMLEPQAVRRRFAPTSLREGFSTNAAIWLIAVLFLLFIAVLGLLTWQARSDAKTRAEDRALAAAQVVATNTRWIVELSQQALRRIDESLGSDLDVARGQVIDINQAVDALPGSVRAYVIGANGQVIYSTANAAEPDPTTPLELRDRPYFARPAAGEQWYVSSLLVSRVSGEQVFVFSRRLERDGRFAGVAVISFNVLLLKEIWQSLGFDQESTVSIIRDDGQLVARYPLAPGPIDMSQYVLFTEYLKQSDHGTYPAISPADGVARFVGYQKLEQAPLLAVASISASSAYRRFWRDSLTLLVLALPGALALGGAAFWIGQLLRRDARRQVELERAIAINQLLFRDIHHRVKNNLQSVQSLVRMQSIPPNVKMDLQRRIAAMTAVHEHIYRLDQYVEVDAKLLIPAIVEPLIQSFGHDVKVEFDIDPIDVERDSATPLALLVNELVTNALKYAFVGGKSGTIRVSFKAREANRAELIVSDDGVGFDPSEPMTGMGSRLIKAMVTQMGGTQTYRNADGTHFSAELAIRSAHYPPKGAGETPVAA